jgi:hypothetical protein
MLKEGQSLLASLNAHSPISIQALSFARMLTNSVKKTDVLQEMLTQFFWRT